MDEFINISNQLGKNVLYAQGAGGNSSVKIGGKLYIKASGFKLKDINHGIGYACIEYKPLLEYITHKDTYHKTDEHYFIQLMNSHIIEKETFGKPSMETGFHAIIPSKYVFHLHSVYANIFNCMKFGSRIISTLCDDLNYIIVEYKNPGYELAYVLSKKHTLPPLIFLKNHGLIIHGNNIKDSLKLIEMLHIKLERYLKKKIKKFQPFSVSNTYNLTDKYSFPDSAVFANIKIEKVSKTKRKDLIEIYSAQRFITDSIYQLGKNPLFLSNSAIDKLLSMDQEKHRLNVFHKK